MHERDRAWRSDVLLTQPIMNLITLLLEWSSQNQTGRTVSAAPVRDSLETTVDRPSSNQSDWLISWVLL